MTSGGKGGDDDDDDDSDDDMLITQAEVNLNCPITRLGFMTFIKLKLCHHEVRLLRLNLQNLMALNGSALALIWLGHRVIDGNAHACAACSIAD